MSTSTELNSKLAKLLQGEVENFFANNSLEKLTDEERQIVELFRILPKDTQAAFKNLLDNVAKKFPAPKPCGNYITRDDDDDSSTDDLPEIGTPLNDCTWEQISAVSKAGLGAKYFNIGDRKEITLNGKIGDCLKLDNEKLNVFILHFNYPLNGKPDNNIIWGGFKTADGTDVALCDGKYDNYLTDGTICFNMNHRGQIDNSSGNGYYGTNYGGWKGCDLRYDILGATSQAPSQYNQLKSTGNVGYDATAATLTNPKSDTLLAALPADFRNALRLWSRWVDAVGNESNVNANIKPTVDAVTLLTEFEIHGARSYANEYEQNHQTQMAYYKNGNGTIKNNPASNSSAVWWLASPIYGNNCYFCIVDIDGSANSNNAGIAYGLAPAFMT